MHRARLLLVFMLVWGVVSAQTFTPCTDKTVAMESYISHGKKNTTISADFEQTKVVPYLVEPLITSGKFYAKGADIFRWEQIMPEVYIMILNNEKGLIFQQGKWSSKDLGRNRQFDFIGQLLGVLVSGQLPKSGEFITECSENSDHLKLELVPENARVQKYISRIICLARKSDYLLDEIQMLDADGNITTIIFTNQLSNTPLDEDLFRAIE